MRMEEIERAMGQFGGAFDGAAGPIRSVTARTCDVLPMMSRAAELLHSGIDLQQRTARLLLRLELGIQGAAVDLARHTDRALDRGDYRRLCEAGMTARETLATAEDSTLLRLLGNDRRKLTAVRDAVDRWRAARPPTADQWQCPRTSSSPGRWTGPLLQAINGVQRLRLWTMNSETNYLL
jgi:hypothetical protein